VGGRAVYERIAEFAFSNGLQLESEEHDGDGRNSVGAFDGELDAEWIIGEFEASQFGFIFLEERREIATAAP